MSRTDSDFSSHGTRVAAWLYRPDIAEDAEVPCLVMAHGFSAVRDQRLPAFAEAFATAGYAALVFDYRHFGDSDGEPRQLLDIRRQLDDWRAAIAHARELPGINGDRIVVWGTSFSGGHAVTLAAEDHRLAAAIAQGPFVDGPRTLASYGPRYDGGIAGPVLTDTLRRLLGRPPLLIPAVGDPGSRALIATPDALAGFTAATGPGSTWRNEVAARVGLQVLAYRPLRRAARIRCPVLYCVARDDVITPPGPARLAAARTPRGELREYDGRHFDIYVEPLFSRIVADEVEFLRRVVPVAVDGT